MEIPATVTSKGQITIPAAVRRALQLQPGDRLLFRLVGDRALMHVDGQAQDSATAEMEKIPNFLDLAGSVPTPDEVKGKDWATIRDEAWTAAVRDPR